MVSAVVVAVSLVAVALLAVVRSVYLYRRSRRREAIRERVRPELLDRLYGADEIGGYRWSDWVRGMSASERDVLEGLVGEYLREIQGEDAEPLRTLAVELGVSERAHRRVRLGDRYERLRALTWLSLLRDPPDTDAIRSHCMGTPQERAAAVRALYDSGYPRVGAAGVDILLGEGPEPLSIFGIDTLYRSAERDASAFFDRVESDYESWDPALQQQVLLVCRHLHTAVGDADLTWITEALSAPEERTRMSAADTAGRFGWRDSVREGVDTESVCTDPSPRVRGRAYRMLGEWGTEGAMATLKSVATTDADDRARAQAGGALAENRDRITDVPEELYPGYRWTIENKRFDELVRDTEKL